MNVSTWPDTARGEDELRWVAEIFERETDDEPTETLAWFATERDAEVAAWERIEAIEAERGAMAEIDDVHRNGWCHE